MADLLLATEPLADLLVQLVEKRVERQSAGSDAFEAITVRAAARER